MDEKSMPLGVRAAAANAVRIVEELRRRAEAAEAELALLRARESGDRCPEMFTFERNGFRTHVQCDLPADHESFQGHRASLRWAGQAYLTR
jgi:hypothetical protein